MGNLRKSMRWRASIASDGTHALITSIPMSCQLMRRIDESSAKWKAASTAHGTAREQTPFCNGREQREAVAQPRTDRRRSHGVSASISGMHTSMHIAAAVAAFAMLESHRVSVAQRQHTEASTLLPLQCGETEGMQLPQAHEFASTQRCRTHGAARLRRARRHHFTRKQQYTAPVRGAHLEQHRQRPLARAPLRSHAREVRRIVEKP